MLVCTDTNNMRSDWKLILAVLGLLLGIPLATAYCYPVCAQSPRTSAMQQADPVVAR